MTSPMSWEATSEPRASALRRRQLERADDAAQHLGDEELAQQLRRPLVADRGPEQRQAGGLHRAVPDAAAAGGRRSAPSSVAPTGEHLGQQVGGVGRRLRPRRGRACPCCRSSGAPARGRRRRRSRCRGWSRRRSRARRRRRGPRRAPPPGCRGCRGAVPAAGCRLGRWGSAGPPPQGRRRQGEGEQGGAGHDGDVEPHRAGRLGGRARPPAAPRPRRSAGGRR